jgi:ABC-2 type transport system permease protein
MSAPAIALPLRSCLQYARVGFVNTLAYRLRYYTGIITYLINVTVYYFIWKALYAGDPNFAAGFRFEDMVTYIAVGWVIRSVYFNNIDQNMATDVMEGNIAMTMLKPVSVQTVYVGQALGEAGFRLLLLTLPSAVVVALIFPVQGPASVQAFGLFLLSLGASIVLTAGLNFIVGCCAVRLKSILGLLRAKFYVQELLSGLLVPMTMFPPVLQNVMAYLPFEHIAYTPLRIYLGKLEGAAAWEALGVQALWGVLLLAFGHHFWHVMARKITIHGG